jgi:branched-chain amino acid transport system ATP-binding protein
MSVIGLRINDVSVRFGAVSALSGVTVDFPAGQICGLVGPNGAGKTTLLNSISGFTTISGGTLHLGEEEIQRLSINNRVRRGIVRGFQTVRLLERESVFDNVAVGCERLGQPNVVSQVLNLPGQRRTRRRDHEATRRVLSALGLDVMADRRVDELPFASRRLVEVGRVLVSEPAVLLLDEPAAGLPPDGRVALTEVIRDVHEHHPCTVIVVEHDVEVVKRLCTFAVALDSGRVIATGTPASVLRDEAVQIAYFGTGHHAAH